MKNISLAIVMALFMASCAQHQVAQQKVEQEIKEVPDHAKLKKESIRAKIMSTSLSDEQKEKLIALEETAHQKQVEITDELEKAKIVLVESILRPKINEKEVKILKKKITDLDKERLQNGFKTLREARKIIAPKAEATPAEHEIYKAIIHDRLKGY